MKSYRIPPEFDIDVVQYYRKHKLSLEIVNSGVHAQMLNDALKTTRSNVKLIAKPLGEVVIMPPVETRRTMLPENCIVQLSKFRDYDDVKDFNAWLVDLFAEHKWSVTDICVATEAACFEGTVPYSRVLVRDACSPLSFLGAVRREGSWYFQEMTRADVIRHLKKEFDYDYALPYS